MSAPVIIRKNSRDELRVSIDEFKGHQLVNMRVWFEGNDGQMRPGNDADHHGACR